MRKIFIFLFIGIATCLQAQTVYYAAAKTGISLREAPNVNAKVMVKIAYGEKLSALADTFPPVTIVTEGFTNSWWKVDYNGKQGYVVGSYLLPIAPPRAGTKNLRDYFLQVTKTVGDPLIIKETDETMNEMGERTITKQFYKNGMEWHQTQGYETGADVYILPGFTIAQSFLLVRILNQYPDLIGEKDLFPVKKSKAAISGGEKTIDIEREDGNSTSPIKKITITSTQAVVTEFEIFTLGEQAVIYWSSGV